MRTYQQINLPGVSLSAALCLLTLAMASCASEPSRSTSSARRQGAADASAPNTLTAQEREAGWELLFNGETFAGWTGLGRDTIPRGHWTIEKGTIHKVESGQVPTAPDGQPLEGGDLMTEATYGHFVLAFDWKVAKGANSGIKYNVSEEMSTAHEPEHAALGFEYQVLDDKRHPDAKVPTHRAAALYDLIAPDTSRKDLRPVGQWNHGRVVFCGGHGEHWLNGEKVLAYDLNAPRFDSLFAASKYADIEGFAQKRSGHIVLQDHGDAVWYRNVKIRTLSPNDCTAE